MVDTSGSPVAQADIYVFHAEQAWVGYGGPNRVIVEAPSEKAWWFFRKRNGLRSFEGATDQEGRFVAYGLAPGPYRVLVVHPQRGVTVSPELTQPNPGNVATITLEAATFLKGQIKGLALGEQPETRLFANLRPEGRHADVDFHFGFLSYRVEVKADGTLEGGPLLSGGDFRLRVARYVFSRSFAAVLLEKSITLEKGKTTELVLDQTQGEKINGQILDPEGKPLDWVAVSVEPPKDATDSPWSVLGDLTDREGRFTLGGLAPGTYHLTARRWLPRTGFG